MIDNDVQTIKYVKCLHLNTKEDKLSKTLIYSMINLLRTEQWTHD